MGALEFLVKKLPSAAFCGWALGDAGNTQRGCTVAGAGFQGPRGRQGGGIRRMQAGAEMPHAAGGHTHSLALLQESSFSTD